MIKPGAVQKRNIGPILNMISRAGFKITAMKLTKLSTKQAEEFYIVHRSKPFYESLVEFMSSGPIVAAILEKENAVEEKIERPTMIIPGLAETERNSIRQLTRWEVLVGPVSGFLLPLFILNNK